MFSDIHIHTRHNRCASPEMTIPSILERAIEMNIDQVGLVVHFHPDDDSTVFHQAAREIEEARGAFPGQVLLGAEIDLMDQDGATSWRDELLGTVDYVLLAMGHTQMAWVQADVSLDPETFLIRQTESLLTALGSIPTTAVAHPYIYGALHKQSPVLAHALRPHLLPASLVRELAAGLIDGGIVFEYHCRDLLIRPQNLGGAAFVTSYAAFLDFLRELGVRFIAGSDAHYLDQIGRSAHAPAWAQNPLPVPAQELHG